MCIALPVFIFEECHLLLQICNAVCGLLSFYVCHLFVTVQVAMCRMCCIGNEACEYMEGIAVLANERPTQHGWHLHP